MHTLSVLIPAYNEEELLPRCLGHVQAALDRVAPLLARSEIVVCDNNSTDRTAEIASAHGCKVVFEPLNQIARARNAAAKAAGGDWLLFVDADSWPPPELLEEAVATMKSGRYVGCGSTIRIVDGPLWFKWAWESKNWSMRLLKWCPGGFILCQRSAFEVLGGFPVDYYIFEEAEFVRRLKRAGKLRNLGFTVLHKHPFSASGRKGAKYGLWSWIGTAFRFWLAPTRRSQDRAFAAKWYDDRK